jgi:hypothetical protein
MRRDQSARGRLSLDRVTAIRFAIGVFGLVTVGLSVIGFWAGFDDPRRLATDEIRTVVEGWGLPIELPMWLGLVLPMTASTVTATFIFLRCGRDVVAMTFALMLVTGTSFTTRGLLALSAVYPSLAPVATLVSLVGLSLLFYVVLVFPSQRFGGRLSALFWVGATLFMASRPDTLASVLVRRVDAQTAPIDRVYLAGYIALSVILFAAQIMRYLRSSGEGRLQMKWVMLPIAALLIYVTIMILIPSLFFELSPVWFGTAMVGSIPFSVVFPICIARGVLKYRLYEIDVVINRTLVYGALTAVLALTYVALVFGVQTVLSPFTQQSDIAIAASTLAVAALFRPVESRVQDFIDRRFYRRKFDTQRTLERFSAHVRNEVDLEDVRQRLVAVVRETMQPAHASVWLRDRPVVSARRPSSG